MSGGHISTAAICFFFLFVFFENYICANVLNCSVFLMFLSTEFVQMMTGK